MTRDQNKELAGLSTQELAGLARDCLEALGRQGSKDAFAELLQISPIVGEALGEVARSLEENSSWAQVGQIAGTTKQAAWSRWRS